MASIIYAAFVVKSQVMFCLAFTLHCLLAAATVADVSEWPDRAYSGQWSCELSGTVTIALNDRIVLEDQTSRVKIYAYWIEDVPEAGSIVNVKCTAIIDDAKRNVLCARKIVVTGKTDPPQPVDTTISRIMRGEHDLAPIRVRGMVVDVTPDDIEPNNSFIHLSDGREIIAVAVTRSSKPERLVGAEIEVTGYCDPEIGCWRQFQGRGLLLLPGSTIVRVVTPPPKDPFSAPPLFAVAKIGIHNLAALGRRSVTGRVLATWHGDSVLLSAATRGRWNTFQATLAKGQALPRCGDIVQVVGFPRTDLFTITLDNALCRPSKDLDSVPTPADSEPKELSADKLMSNNSGLSQVQALYHGQTIRIRGRVRSVPSDDFIENRMQMQSGEYIVPVDVSSCPKAVEGISRDCEVEVTGVCMLVADPWRADVPVPRVRGFNVIVRDAGDIKVLSRPPWWTPARLLVVICALILAIVAFFVWNWLLRRVVARRSRELLKSEIRKAESDLRIGERTALAAEIHDAISQTLTGVSFQIDAAVDTIDTDLPAAKRFLDIARQTLLSCREELRRCLWDLRSNALEESDFEEALRRAIRPGIGKARATVHFDVRRSQMSDSTAHAILCIVRELCVNAVRHGEASSIQIEGGMENGSIRFTVDDNGHGFDPAASPGPSEGHFGLQGIRERVSHLGGSIAIKSGEGKGTRIMVEVRK